VIVFLFIGLLIFVLIVVFLLKKNKEGNQGWRFRKIGEGQLQYAQIHDELWESISFRLTLYAKDVPRHKIEVPEDWSVFPGWAQQEKELILERLSKSFPAPQYTIVMV